MTDEPPSEAEITDKRTALEALNAYKGSTLLRASYARAIADQWETDIDSKLRPISEMDRLQPDNDELAIGVGMLCKRIAEGIDGIDAESGKAVGHGRAARERKDGNLPKIEKTV